MRGKLCILPWLVAARDNFNCRAALIPELSQKLAHFNSAQRIPAGMRDYGNTAAAGYPTHGFTEARPLMRNETGLACAEIALERAMHVFYRTLLNEKAREMCTADHVGIGGEFADTLGAPFNARRL